MALCWGQNGTYNMELPVSQGPWPLKAPSLSCFCKLCLEALVSGFEGDESKAWNAYTILVMESILEDVHAGRDVLSMMDLLALADPPPETYNPNTLCTAFHSYFAFGDTHSSMDGGQ
jgi:hypothetical protein